ncbi:Gfo/Idh/MocA family oxidoreductase [soil metagenome]
MNEGMKLAFVGGWGHHTLRPLLSDSTFFIHSPVAIASDGHDAARSKERAVTFGVPTVFFDRVDDMLDQYKPDVVNVGAIYGYAGDVIAKVIERSVSVVSDKPIAATWQQFKTLSTLLQKHPVNLITEFTFRTQPEFQAARDAVASGLIGEVVLATAQKSYRFGQRPSWYGDRNAYGSTIMWVAGHGIDAIHFVTGQKFTRVTGRHANLSHPELSEFEDHSVSLFGLAGGGSALVHADLLRPDKAGSHGDDRLRVVGTLGQIEIRDGRCVLVTRDAGAVDITERAVVRPAAHEFLAAAMGESDSIYSTARSLYLAEVLLHARDAADSQTWIDLK